MTETLGVLGFALSLVIAFNQLWRERPDVYVHADKTMSRIRASGSGVEGKYLEPEGFTVRVVNVSSCPIVVSDVWVNRASLAARQFGVVLDGVPALPRRMETNDLAEWYASVAELSIDREKPVVVSVRFYARRRLWQLRQRSRLRIARSAEIDLSDQKSSV